MRRERTCDALDGVLDGSGDLLIGKRTGCRGDLGIGEVVSVRLEESVGLLDGERATMVMDELLQRFHQMPHAKLFSFAEATNESLSARCDEIGGTFANLNHRLLTVVIAAMDEDTLSFHGNIAALDDHLTFTSVEGETIDLGKGVTNTL